MQKYKDFLKFQLPYFLITSISLVLLFIYLENMPTVRDRKNLAFNQVAAALQSSVPQLAFALNQLPSPSPTPPVVVAGASTEVNDSEQIHVVKKGEHLWLIAQKYYGDGYKAFEIAKYNNINNPDLIYEGISIKIPNL